MIRLYAAAGYSRGELTMHASPSLFGGARHRRQRPRRGDGRAADRPAPDYLAAPETDVTLVVLHKGAQRGKKVLDALQGPARGSSTAPAIKTDRDKSDFAAHEFRRPGRKATGEAVHALVEAVGKDVRELAVGLPAAHRRHHRRHRRAGRR